MTTAQRSRRRGITWAVVGGIVLLAGIIAILISAITGSGASPTPTTSATADSTTTPSSTSTRDVVDESATDHGWIPEPITTDAETYIRSALAAASTFDTTLATRDEWLSYLDTWFTPDTRYPEGQRTDRMTAAKLELRQGIVLPQETWGSLAAQEGRVEAAVTGDVTITDVPEDTSGDMRIGTADVELTFTQADGSGGKSSYAESARVSVQVLCGEASVPTPNSAQHAGDCKVVRYFTEPAED